jgi:putative acetyltransferase
MQFQDEITPITPEDFPQVVAVWEASVRATHHFVSEADIQIFRPLVQDALPDLKEFVGVRDLNGRVAGFMGVVDQKVEMLFLSPEARGQGAGKRLLDYAVTVLGATSLDVNEQNEQAVGFYLHNGFEVAGRSELDGMGKPYPLLHLRLSTRSAGNQAAK